MTMDLNQGEQMKPKGIISVLSVLFGLIRQ